MGMSDELGHYNIYRQKCMESGIEMQTRCIPDDEHKRLELTNGGGDSNTERCVMLMRSNLESMLTTILRRQTSIMDFAETITKAPEWTKDELEEQIICFIIETDQVCY